MNISLIFKIALIGLVTAVASILLKKANKEEIGNLVSIAGLVLALILVIDMVIQLFETIISLFEL